MSISYKDLGQGRRIRQLLPVLIWVQTIDIKPPQKKIISQMRIAYSYKNSRIFLDKTTSKAADNNASKHTQHGDSAQHANGCCCFEIGTTVSDHSAGGDDRLARLGLD